MDGSRLRSGIYSGTYLEDWIHTSYSRILKCCLCTGLASSEADDIAQDIWLWLLREGSLAREVSTPWLAAVARNFILRYWRRKYRRSTLEECSLDACPEPRTQEVLRELEVDDLLDRVAAALPETERRMLALIRSGHSLAESARLLGVPRGSRGYYQRRLVACARRELARRGGSASPADYLSKSRGTPPRQRKCSRSRKEAGLSAEVASSIAPAPSSVKLRNSPSLPLQQTRDR
jgi:DNA-directed RNA polymerase specialized sigma24 family protein